MDQPIHILHVDDDSDFLDLAATFLERENERFIVETATNADEALDRFREHQFHCIVSDFDMPGRNGIELLETVREESPDLPFILFTGKGSEEIASEAISAGVTDYLQKGSGSSQYDILAQRIRNAVEASQVEQELEAALSRMTDAIYTVDTDWRITYVNEGAEEILGPKEELLGEILWEQFPDAAEGVVWETYHAAMKTQEPKTFEVFYEPLDLWAAGTAYPSETGLTVYFLDVTEQKERERLLERYELIVETTSDPIYTLDDNMYFTLVNTAVAEFTGLDQEELTGAHIATAFDDDHVDGIVDATTVLLSSDQRQITIETESTAASGDDHIFQTTITQKPTSEDEAFRGVVCVSRDITSLKEHERRLSVLDRVLRHNLRNKLNIVVGEVARIRDTTDSADILGPIERINSASQELLSLGESARKFHSILEPSERVAVEETNVAAAARRVVAEVNASVTDSSVRVEAPEEAWAQSHKALELSITELIENAIQHSESAVEVVVTVTVDSDDGTVVIRVTDDGPGIPERERRALMSGLESPLEHTMGLGLWFVRWMATNSGGSMSVGDIEPTGTVVELHLPLSNQIDITKVT